MAVLSERQRHIATYGAREKRWTLVSGPVGSGKTHSGLLGFSLWQRLYAGHEFGLLTKGHPQLASIIRDMERAAGFDIWVDSDGMAALPTIGGMDNALLCFVGRDKSAEPRLRSFNLTGFVIDEGTTLPFPLIAAANARMRVGDPRGLILTNPDGPRHPLKVQYFDDAENMDAEAIYTSIHDNPTVTQSYIDSLHRSYSGHMLERMVNGRWAAATGLVYPHYLEVVREMPNPSEFQVLDASVDVGESSVTHALLYGRDHDGDTWVIDECRHDHIVEGVLSIRGMVAKVRREFAHWGPIHSWTVDPSALTFRQELLAQGEPNVGKAHADWTEGHQEVNHWIGLEALLLVEKSVPHLMNELGALVWDDDAADKGDDKPIPTSDHGTDTLRHYVLTRTIHESGGRRAWEARKRHEREVER